jgi:hypothetical protein
MIATALVALALAAAPGGAGPCRAPECLVQVGPGAPPSGPLQLDAQRTGTRLRLRLSRAALVTLRRGGHTLDRWVAPAGSSVRPLAPAAGTGVLRLRAVDGAGSTVTRLLPAP